MLGVISSRRDCCASRNVGSGRSSKCYLKINSQTHSFWFLFRNETLEEHTRVVWRTLHRRGKSFTPASRVDIELSRIWREDCSEVTEEDNEAAILCDLKLDLEMIVYNGRDRSGCKSGMTPPLRRRGLGTGQTSQTSLLLFRPPASPSSRTPNSLRIRFTCHNVSPRKEVPRRSGYVFFRP